MTDAERAKLTAIQAMIGELLAVAPSAPLISSVADFDKAYAAAATGATLRLSNGFAYDKLLDITKPINLVGETVGMGRIAMSDPAPMFAAGARLRSDDVTLLGLELRHQVTTTDIVGNVGARLVMDRCRVLGDPLKGAKRGIAANGAGAQAFRRCYIADIFQPAQDTQAICFWDCEPGITIEDCYLEAAGQSVMAGGADSSSAERTPSQIRIVGSHLTKNPLWFTMKMQIKCALELKNASGVEVDDCILEYGGISQGQGAYLIVVTPRNQGGKAPWSAVQNVVISDCTGGHAGGILNVLGSDNNAPSGIVQNLTLQHSTFDNIDPKGITLGSGRLFMFDRAPEGVTISDVKVVGANIAALGYFDGAMPKALKLEHLIMPVSKYGWKIDGGGAGRKALLAAMPDAQLDDTVV